MKKVVLMGLFIATLCAGCSGQVPAGMHKFKLGEKMDIEGARVHFKLNKSGDSLFVHIHKPWPGDPEKDVQYEVSIYDKDKQLIQSSVHKSKRKYSNISRNFSMIDNSNVDQAAYFSVKISE
jgi:hypothetical protein